MSVKKVKTKNGLLKWEVHVYTHGRGSRRLLRRFDKKSEALDFLDEYKARQRELKQTQNGVKDFEETTFREEAEYWLLHQGKRFSPSHLKRVKGILAEILPPYGSLSPIKIQPGFLSHFQSDELRKGRRPETVNRKTEVITAILNFSTRHRRIPYNPAIGFEKLRSHREGVSFWEKFEAVEFLDYCNSKYPKGSALRWVYVVYLMAINTALRAGEIWGMQPQDMVSGGEILLIQRQFDRVAKQFRPLKWKMPPRNVPCNQDLRAELKALIRDNEIPCGKTVFTGSDGKKPVCHETFVKAKFHKDVAESGVRPIRFHDLRHTATTLMIASGLDLKTVQEICGHKNVKTTMDYCHLLGENVKKVARTFSVSPEKPQNGQVEPLLRVVSSS